MVSSQLVQSRATLCIVNYRTLDLTRLCLRCIRRFTQYPCEVIVVDNDSRDQSLEYLRSLNWIRLVERGGRAGVPRGGYAHASALDQALQDCRTEFFVVLHSDAFVRREGWLGDLVGHFAGDPETACVGSGKLESIPKWRVFLKKSTDLRRLRRTLLGAPDTRGRFRYYNRTICCLYRTDILRRERLSFLMGSDQGLAPGKRLYFELVDRGYRTVELPPSRMGRYVVHVGHATQAANPQEFILRRHTLRKCRRSLKKVMSSELFRSIVEDDSLDR